jgi:hypothetical protein
MAKFTEEELKRANFKMSKAHKKLFIDALRSGDYERAEGAYITDVQGDNGKPCLCAAGVYLAQLNEIEDLLYAQEDGDMCSIDFGDLHKDDNHDLIGHIIDMNDALSCSFEMIAMWIEENVKGVSVKQLQGEN